MLGKSGGIPLKFERIKDVELQRVVASMLRVDVHERAHLSKVKPFFEDFRSAWPADLDVERLPLLELFKTTERPLRRASVVQSTPPSDHALLGFARSRFLSISRDRTSRRLTERETFLSKSLKITNQRFACGHLPGIEERVKEQLDRLKKVAPLPVRSRHVDVSLQEKAQNKVSSFRVTTVPRKSSAKTKGFFLARPTQNSAFERSSREFGLDSLVRTKKNL